MSDVLVDTCRVRDDAGRLSDAATAVDDAAASVGSTALAIRSSPWGGVGAWGAPFLAVRAAQIADEVDAAASVARLLADDLASLAGNANDAAGAFEIADDDLAFDLRTLAVGTAPLQEPLVGALALMLDGPHVPGLPAGDFGFLGGGRSVQGAVGSIADALARLTGFTRRAYADQPRIEVVERAVLPAPQSSVDALQGVQRVSDQQQGASLVAVQELRDASGESRWIVSVPGTNMLPGTTFGWHQNFELMSADATERETADSVLVVQEAMDLAGVGPDDDVMLVGHSQGGLAAAVVAASDLRVKRLLTAGAPVAGHRLPPRVRALHVEVPGEVVSALDGRPNPIRAGRVTVRGDADLTVGASSDVIPHAVKYHEAALDEALANGGQGTVADAEIAAVNAEIEEFLDAELVGQTVVESRLVPEVHATEPTDKPRDPPREPESVS